MDYGLKAISKKATAELSKYKLISKYYNNSIEDDTVKQN